MTAARPRLAGTQRGQQLLRRLGGLPPIASTDVHPASTAAAAIARIEVLDHGQ